jgi:hypothetical protein
MHPANDRLFSQLASGFDGDPTEVLHYLSLAPFQELSVAGFPQPVAAIHD